MFQKEMGGVLQHERYLPSQATLGTDDTWTVWVAPTKVQIYSVTFTPDAAITANATHYSIYTLTRYTLGASAASVATRSWAATSSVASTSEAFTLSATAANLVLAADDTLSMVKTHGGNGLVIPHGSLLIRYKNYGV